MRVREKYKPEKCISFLDEELYDELTENDVIDSLNDITEEYFLSLRDQLEHILEK